MAKLGFSKLVFIVDDWTTPRISSSGCILCIASIIGSGLPLLPYDYVDSNRVPIIFKGRPSTFHAFVVSTMFAFSGALSELLVHKKQPKIARLCQYYSSVSILSAAGFLIYATFS